MAVLMVAVKAAVMDCKMGSSTAGLKAVMKELKRVGMMAS